MHDCLAWAFEYISICKRTKKEMVIVKLDFEKAFDRVEYQAILQILQHKGFPQKWILWIKDILGSATSAVLLNGVPGKTFIAEEELDREILYLYFFLFWLLTCYEA